MAYRTNEKIKFDCGFPVSGRDVRLACERTGDVLGGLPSNLYKSIDYKTTSAMIGAIFCNELAVITKSYVNPIEKGHPDILPVDGSDCTEEELRNYPEGLEVKCTIGNIEKGANLRAGNNRLDKLTGITWQAHHREVTELLGLVWDFAGSGSSFSPPIITGAFYSTDLCADDWGKISGTTGRNTKVTGMTASGKAKMGRGWVVLLNSHSYVDKYSRLLDFTP